MVEPFSITCTTYFVTALPPGGVPTALQETFRPPPSGREASYPTGVMLTFAGAAGITSALKEALQGLGGEVPMALIAVTEKRDRCPVGKPSKVHTVDVHS
jgi:hypothetical protein